MADLKHHSPTFEDAWQLWREVEGATGARVECAVHCPRTLQSGAVWHARVAVSITRYTGGKARCVAEYCQIGGTRGARTVPAALIRALTALQARVESEAEEVARQASF